MTTVGTSVPAARSKSALELLPQYIVVGTGLTYAAGFLVIQLFLDRFGIRDASAELWKARYIHIGILSVLFPFIANGTILSLTHLIFHGKFDRPVMWQRLLPVGLLVINMEIVCFALIMFTRRDASGGIVGLLPLQWILGLTLIGMPLILGFGRVLERYASRAPSSTPDAELTTLPHTLTVNLRWILTLAVAAFDFWYFLEFSRGVTGASPWLMFTYVGLSLLLGVVVSTAVVYGRRQVTDGRRRAIAVLGVAVGFPLAYLVILAYSYAIYPHVLSTRGGGDFTEAPKVTITFKNAAPPAPQEQRYLRKDTPQSTIQLVVIEETSWGLFLADPTEAGGPAEWKLIGGRKPQILVVNKTEVSRVHCESRVP